MEWLVWLVGALVLGGLIVLAYFIILALGYQLQFEWFKSQGKDDDEADRLARAELDKILAGNLAHQVPWP